MTIVKQAFIILEISKETLNCRDCKFGKIIGSKEIRIDRGSEMGIPLSVLVTPKIERNCLNPVDRYIRRMKPKVRFYARCVKLEKYSPKAENTSDKSA